MRDNPWSPRLMPPILMQRTTPQVHVLQGRWGRSCGLQPNAATIQSRRESHETIQEGTDSRNFFRPRRARTRGHEGELARGHSFEKWGATILGISAPCQPRYPTWKPRSLLLVPIPLAKLS